MKKEFNNIEIFIQEQISKLINKKKEFGIVCFKISDFKYINNLYGNDLGNEILKKIEEMILCDVGDNGCVIKLLGGEFIALYMKDSNKKISSAIIDSNIKNKITFKVKSIDIKLNISIGCVFYPEDGSEYGDLINKCYFAMDTNENIFFSKESFDKKTRSIEIRNKIREGMEKNEFEIYLQPIHNENNIIKCEVLLRWFSEELGCVPTDKIIECAEENGDIIPLGYWIIEESFKAYNVIKNKVDKSIVISINISGIQLYEKDLVNNIEILKNIYNIKSEHVIFELTENILIYGNEIAHKNINKLKKIGFQIALDDFGTGYSSLSYIELFDIDIFKIDKFFVQNKKEEAEFYMIKRLIEFSQSMNIKIIVEGIETKEQFEILKKFNCDFYQGYYFSKPLPLQAFIKYLSSSIFNKH